MGHVLRAVAVILAAPVVLSGAAAPAQQSGQVEFALSVGGDPLGLVGADVFLKPAGTGPSRTSRVGNRGIADFVGIAPGRYQLVFALPMFTPHAAELVHVQPGGLTTLSWRSSLEPIAECIVRDTYTDTPDNGHVGKLNGRRVDPNADHATMLGKVTDSAGHAIAAARVQLTKEASGWIDARRTELSGEFGIGELRAGSYRLEVRAAGYLEYDAPIRLVGGRQRNIRVALTPRGDSPAIAPLVFSVDTGLGRIVLGLHSTSPIAILRDLLARADRNDLDDTNLRRTGDAEFDWRVGPHYFAYGCGERYESAGGSSAYQLSINASRDRLTFAAAGERLDAVVMAGQTVLDRLLRLPTGRVVSVMDVSRAGGPFPPRVAFLQDPSRTRRP